MQLFYAKKPLEKKEIFEKSEHFKNCQKWPRNKGYRLCKTVTFGQKLKMQKKDAKNVSTTRCSCFMQKNGSKEQLIFEKLEHFENCKKWPPSKGHRLCQIVTLGQKLKMHKNMLKTFLQQVAVVLCKKRLEKAANI